MTNCGKYYEGSKQSGELEDKGKTSPTLERGGRRGLSENRRCEGCSHAMSRCEECSKGSPGWSAPHPSPRQRGSHSVRLGVSQGDETAVLRTGTFWVRGQGASPLMWPFFPFPYHCLSLCVEKTERDEHLI